jgi:hypothetical protein
MRTLLIAGLIIASASAHAQTTFTGTLKLTPDWMHIKTEGASTVIETFASIIDAAHTTGTNANQMTSFVRIVGTLTNGASVVHNLSGGVTNSFGDAVTFRRVNFLTATAPTSNVSKVMMGGAATDTFSAWTAATNDTAALMPGGAVMLRAPDATGYAVATNACNLKLVNTGTNSVGYALYIGGVQ